MFPAHRLSHCCLDLHLCCFLSVHLVCAVMWDCPWPLLFWSWHAFLQLTTPSVMMYPFNVDCLLVWKPPWQLCCCHLGNAFSASRVFYLDGFLRQDSLCQCLDLVCLSVARIVKVESKVWHADTSALSVHCIAQTSFAPGLLFPVYFSGFCS